jgi:cell division protein FtsB
MSDNIGLTPASAALQKYQEALAKIEALTKEREELEREIARLRERE